MKNYIVPARKRNIYIASFEKGLSRERSENVLPIKYAYDVSNFDYSKGALTRSLGFAPIYSELAEIGTHTYPHSITNAVKMWFYRRFDPIQNIRDDRIVFITNEFRLFYFKVKGDRQVKPITDKIYFTSVPSCLCYRYLSRDVLVLTSPTDNMVIVDDETITAVVDAPKITSMAIHYERLFATVSGEASSVWFSDDFNPTNWTLSLSEAGFIEMLDERGRLLKVISFLDYLFVFREYGISRITAFAEQTSYSVAQLFVSSGKLYDKTITLCGNKILFLSDDGFYVFDGLSSRSVLPEISEIIDVADRCFAKSSYSNGKYYISCKIKSFELNNDVKTDVLIVIDTETMEFNIIKHTEILDILQINSDDYSVSFCLAKTENNTSEILEINNTGCYNSVPLVKKWRSPFTDLSEPNKLKTLRSISVCTSEDIKIIINSESESQVVFLKGSSGVSSALVCITGKRFGFEFVSTSLNPNISSPLLSFFVKETAL